MTAEEYYQRNALVHLDNGSLNPQDFRVLSAAPSEVEYALHWLAKDGIGGALLDVGCGPLGLLARAGTRFGRRAGVDIAASPLWAAHPEIKTNIANLDEGSLPFADGEFDAVTCLMVIEHVFDPFHAVRELRRVCKQAGRVVVGVPNLAGLKRRIELLFGRLPVTSTQGSFTHHAWDGYHLHNFTRASLDWLLRREGLKPLRWAAQGRFKTLKQACPSLFGNDLLVLAAKAAPQPDLRFPR